MLEFKKLAIVAAIGASIIGSSTAQADVSYNLSASSANNNDAGPWSGAAPTTYIGNMPVTWFATIDQNASYVVSTADAISKGAASSYVIETLNNKWNPANSWGNALDFGLIDLQSASNLTITVQADGSTFTPGFTLFSGWDTSPTSSKHGSWNVALPAVPVNPRGTSGLTYAGQASTTIAGGVATYTFSGLEAGKYSLWIGGNGTGSTAAGTQKYIANITSAPVPVPGAVWLFGSAMAGLVGFGRRKTALSA